MASLFGMIKCMFGGGSCKKKDASSSSSSVETPVTDTPADLPADPVLTLQHDAEEIEEGIEEVIDSVVAVAVTRTEYVAESAAAYVEQAAETVEDVVEDVVEDIAHVTEEVSHTVTEMADKVAEAVVTSGAVGATAAFDAGQLSLQTPVAYLDRDVFVLPSSDAVQKAVETVGADFGDDGLATGMRVFEYSVAAAKAYDLRVDRELLLIASLFAKTGDGAGARANAFAISAGLWPELAAKIEAVIGAVSRGASADDLEGTALGLGLSAEASGGKAAFINGATSAQIRDKHSG